MSAPLHVLRDAACDGPTNMARDECLQHDTTCRPAVLRLYTWDAPTISLGYFQRCAALAEQHATVRDLPVVRRPTGGGAILHDQELTYCLVVGADIPIATQAPVALYRLVHTCWQAILTADGIPVDLAPDHFPMPTPRTGPFFCFQKPGRTDLILDDQKVLGSAQRRTPTVVLQHGSLLLGRRFAAHPGGELGLPAADIVERWTEHFITSLAATLELTPQPAAWSAAQLADVAARREKYASREWTCQR
jgi:lipoyl(octanoyl) transferase